MRREADADVEREKGNAALQAGNVPAALDAYTRAVSLNVRDFKAYSNRSLVYLKMKEMRAALEDAQRAIQLSPEWAKGHIRKGDVEYTVGLYSQAISSYDTAKKLQSEKDERLDQRIEDAKKSLQIQTDREKQLPKFSAGLGLLLMLILLVLDTYAKRPMLQNTAAFVVLPPILGTLGYFAGIVARWYLRNKRQSYLEKRTQAGQGQPSFWGSTGSASSTHVPSNVRSADSDEEDAGPSASSTSPRGSHRHSSATHEGEGGEHKRRIFRKVPHKPPFVGKKDT